MYALLTLDIRYRSQLHLKYKIRKIDYPLVNRIMQNDNVIKTCIYAAIINPCSLIEN